MLLQFIIFNPVAIESVFKIIIIIQYKLPVKTIRREHTNTHTHSTWKYYMGKVVMTTSS